MKRTTFLSASAPLLVAAAAVLAVGDLNPPPGAVAATGKSLTELEPRIAINAVNTPGDADSLFRITQPGSYFLVGNVTGVAGKSGIEIAANNVVLDLNGFMLPGNVGSLSGITTPAAQSALSIKNGVVRSWGQHGIFQGSSSRGTTIDQVLACNNSLTGFTLGDCATITNCGAFSNLDDGIHVQIGGVISNCSAITNGGDGIFVTAAGTVTACASEGNAGCGIRSTASGYSMIAQCAVADNNLDGILVGSDCTALNNNCAYNGLGGTGSAIHASGLDNRIEGNQCLNSDIGIDVDAPGNFIVRNTCSGNINNWDVAANNIYGPILDRRVPASAAVLGNSATSALGTTDANANFSY